MAQRQVLPSAFRFQMAPTARKSAPFLRPRPSNAPLARTAHAMVLHRVKIVLWVLMEPRKVRLIKMLVMGVLLELMEPRPVQLATTLATGAQVVLIKTKRARASAKVVPLAKRVLQRKSHAHLACLACTKIKKQPRGTRVHRVRLDECPTHTRVVVTWTVAWWWALFFHPCYCVWPVFFISCIERKKPTPKTLK